MLERLAVGRTLAAFLKKLSAFCFAGSAAATAAVEKALLEAKVPMKRLGFNDKPPRPAHRMHVGKWRTGSPSAS